MIRYVILSLCLLCFMPKSVAQGKKESREYWIDKYLSVSFPLQNIKVNSFYGSRVDPFTGKCKLHKGLDLRARYEEVLSMFDGCVKSTGYDKSSGKYVVLQHGDWTISYCHLSEIWVTSQQKLLAGDPVGISGTTGRSTGPHLHISCRLKGQLEDPYNLLLYVRETKARAIKALRVKENNLFSPAEFIEHYAAAAMQQQRKYGIPSSVILAQMALESKWGNSNLAQVGYNFFGIKANQNWLKSGLPYSTHDDDRPNEKFCNFLSPEESIEYHSRLLMSDRYARCWRYKPTDYHNWLLSIKAAGYATRRDYVKVCERIIRQHKLYLYDQQAERM